MKKTAKACALHPFIPAKQLIPVRNLRFGRGGRKFCKVKVQVL